MAALAFAIGRLAIPPVLGDRIGYLVCLGAPAFLLAAPGTVPQAVLQRELGFRRLGIIQVAALVGGTIASVALAATTDANAEALMAGGLVTTALATALSLATVSMAAPRWNRESRGQDRVVRDQQRARVAVLHRVPPGGLRHRGRPRRRGGRRLLLARLPARRGVPGQGHERDAAGELPGVLPHGGHGPHAACARAGGAPARLAPDTATCRLHRTGPGADPVALRPAVGAVRGARLRSWPWWAWGPPSSRASARS